VYNVCTMCVQCVYNVCTMCVQCVYNVCTMCVQCVHRAGEYTKMLRYLELFLLPCVSDACVCIATYFVCWDTPAFNMPNSRLFLLLVGGCICPGTMCVHRVGFPSNLLQL